MNATTDLFFEHHDKVERWARQFAGQDADDIVQETYLKTLGYLSTGHTIQAPASFLFATIRNLATDHYRKKHVDLVHIDVDEIPDESLCTEQQVMSEREFESLVAAVADLPVRMQEAFVLRKVYGYSYREIGDHMGTSSETARKQTRFAFKRILVAAAESY